MQVPALVVDVEVMFDKLVGHRLLEIVGGGAELRQAFDYVLDEVIAVETVLNAHVECGGDGAFFDEAAYVQITVGAPIGEPVDQGG